ERPLEAVQAAGLMAALPNTPAASVWIRELMLRTLTKGPLSISNKSHSVEGAKALHRLETQDVWIPMDSFCQVRRHAPRIRDDHVVRIERIDGLPDTLLNGRQIPAGVVTLQDRAIEWHRRFDAADSPLREFEIEMLHFVSSPSQELREADGVKNTSSC